MLQGWGKKIGRRRELYSSITLLSVVSGQLSVAIKSSFLGYGQRTTDNKGLPSRERSISSGPPCLCGKD
jgi:hypothetical protein